MKVFRLLFIFLFILKASFAEEFIRELPSENLCKQLTPETCKNVDAVIILKEQSFLIHETTIEQRGITFKGPATTRAMVLIVKLFNESAIKRYGSFEYVYPEYFGNDFPNRFDVKARVLKENRKIHVLSKKEIKTIVARKTVDGIPLARKVIFKMPELSAGDILQIEYQYTEVFSRSFSAIFFYNDRDYTLFSNLYITLPAADEARYISVPEEKIGKPDVQQISRDFGSGKTYVWMLRDLNAIPDEPYSRPFADRSLITAFIVEKQGKNSFYKGDWNNIARDFFKYFLDKDKINDEQIESLGFSKDIDVTDITFNHVDQLYRALRKMLILQEFNSLYPQSDNIKSIFKEGKGDASDLAYIMFKILQKWQQNVNAVWIRDQRQGIYEESIPSRLWFDRIGVLVTIQGQEKLYDFDRCIPYNYVLPWFLRSGKVVILSEMGCTHKLLNNPSTIQDNISVESHQLSFDKNLVLKDNVLLAYNGFSAEEFRGNYYNSPEPEIKKILENDLLGSCLTTLDSIELNNFWEESEVNIQMSGLAQIKIDSIENFISFKLKNKLLDDFKNKIYSSIRRSNIYFAGSFQMSQLWEINLPPDYELSSQMVNQKFSLGTKIISNVDYLYDQNILKISARLICTDPFLSLDLYPQLISLLDNTLKEINKDIVLKKKYP